MLLYIMAQVVSQLHCTEKIQDGRYCCNLQFLSQVIQTPFPQTLGQMYHAPFKNLFGNNITEVWGIYSIVGREDPG